MDDLTRYIEIMKKRDRLIKKLPPEMFDYKAMFARVRDAEMKRHRSVKLVHELTGGEPKGHQELLEYLGYPDAEVLSWNRDGPLEYDDGDRDFTGGYVKAARLKGQERPSFFVFLKQREGLPSTGTPDEQVGAKYLSFIMLLMHEMGHVDDLERGKNLRFDGASDFVAAEEYAHLYAARRMMRLNLRIPLGLLLESVLNDSLRKGVETVQRIAAMKIVGAGEFKQFRQFVGSLYDVEGGAPDQGVDPPA